MEWNDVFGTNYLRFSVGRKSLNLIAGRNSTKMWLVIYIRARCYRAEAAVVICISGLCQKWGRRKTFSEQFVKMKTNFEYNSIRILSSSLSALRVVLIKYIGSRFTTSSGFMGFLEFLEECFIWSMCWCYLLTIGCGYSSSPYLEIKRNIYQCYMSLDKQGYVMSSIEITGQQQSTNFEISLQAKNFVYLDCLDLLSCPPYLSLQLEESPRSR